MYTTFRQHTLRVARKTRSFSRWTTVTKFSLSDHTILVLNPRNGREMVLTAEVINAIAGFNAGDSASWPEGDDLTEFWKSSWDNFGRGLSAWPEIRREATTIVEAEFPFNPAR